MKIENLKVLVADEGMMLTDGKGVYSEKVYLGTLDTVENWSEVTKEEAEAAMKKAEEEVEAELQSND